MTTETNTGHVKRSHSTLRLAAGVMLSVGICTAVRAAHEEAPEEQHVFKVEDYRRHVLQKYR